MTTTLPSFGLGLPASVSIPFLFLRPTLTSLTSMNACANLLFPSHPQKQSRHPRQSSGAFNLFEPSQIQIFKEAFSMCDTDSDGIISEKDLNQLLVSLGQTPSPTLVQSLLRSRPAGTRPSDPITFNIFVSMMAEHLSELDTEIDLLEAFACFDDGDTGVIKGSELRKWLREVGDRMSESEIDKLLNGPFTDKKTGGFRYRDFCATLRVTDIDDEEAFANQNMLR